MDLTAVERKIGRIRARIRNLFLASGISRTLIATALLLVLSFLLDYFLDLPVGVRIVSAVIAFLVVLVVLIRTVVFPLSVEIGEDDLALAAEARLPDLRDRLISAIQFQRQLEDPQGESTEMMRAVIDEASRLEQAIRLKEIFDARRVRRHAFAAAGMVLLLALFVLIAPQTTGTWARRNLLFSNEAWPQATTLVVLDFPKSGEKVITRGESLRIDVGVAEGSRIPSSVEIRFQSEAEDDGGEEQRRMYQVEGRPDLFRFEFRQVPHSFTFRVLGGDDPGRRTYRVKALVAPTIEEIRARCEFPAYAGMEPTTFREGDLDLPESTGVRLSLSLNMPVASARFVRDEGEPVEMSLSADRKTATHEFTADRTFEYVVELTGEQGQRNLPDSARFRIRAVPDRKPLVRILHPAARPWFTTKALVPFKVLASDNFGVNSVSLFFKRNDDKEFVERPFTADEMSVPVGAGEIVCYAAVPASELVPDQENPLKVGDLVRFYAEATDNNGNVDRTDPFRIEIVSEDDLARRLSQQQTDLREHAIGTGRRQAQAFRSVEDLLAFLESSKDLEAGDREQLRDLQVLQGIVTREMNSFFGSVSRVLNTYVYNRLAKPTAVERILVLFDDYLKADHTELSTVFKRDLYRKLIEEYRDGRIYEQRILAVLIEIMEITLKITEQSSPEAHRLLGGLARGEPEVSVAEDLEKVRALQVDLLADFRLLDRKMQRWESYANLIQFLRDLKAIQSGVRSGAEKLLKTDNEEPR